MRFTFARRPSAGTVLGAIAVTIACSGVAIGAIPSADGTITACYTKQPRLLPSDAKGSLRVIDGERERCSGEEAELEWNRRGPQGAPGPQGPAGTAKAFARVTMDGTLVAADSHGITQAMVGKAAANPGVVCFRDLPFTPRSVQVTAEARLGLPRGNDIVTSGKVRANGPGCPGESGPLDPSRYAFAMAYNLPGGINGDDPFVGDLYVWFE